MMMDDARRRFVIDPETLQMVEIGYEPAQKTVKESLQLDDSPGNDPARQRLHLSSLAKVRDGVALQDYERKLPEYEISATLINQTQGVTPTGTFDGKPPFKTRVRGLVDINRIFRREGKVVSRDLVITP